MKTIKSIALLLLIALPLTTAQAMEMAELPYRGEGHMMLNAEDLNWTDVASMAPPAKIAIIEGDISQAEAFTFRLKFPDGYKILPHTHPAYERVTVLSGTLHFAHGKEFDPEKTHALGPNDIAIMAPGDPMFGYAEGDTIIQIHGTGPWGIKYIRPEDDPRN